jgi:hypothetical protein
MSKELVDGLSPENSIGSSAGGNASGRGNLVYERLAIDSLEASALPEETLVVDERCDRRPSELVESKLSRLLGGAVLPVSHLQMRGLLKHR